MKSKNVCFAIIFISLLAVGCGGEVSDDEQILATINEYKLTRSDFLRLLAADMETDESFKLTGAAKEKYINEIIQKEILIQEAKRLKFDRKAKFVRTIERYWEATLIRDLMAAQSVEICKTIVVSQEEIRQHYAQLKQNQDDLAPLSQLEKEIAENLKETKKTEMFQAWLKGLREKAKVEIDHKKLANL